MRELARIPHRALPGLSVTQSRLAWSTSALLQVGDSARVRVNYKLNFQEEAIGLLLDHPVLGSKLDPRSLETSFGHLRGS